MLDPKELNDSFVAWTKSIAELTDGEVVAIDGKCLTVEAAMRAREHIPIW